MKTKTAKVRATQSNPDRSRLRSEATGGQAPVESGRRGPAALPGKADELRMIPRTAIAPDPEQPRKTFTESTLQELAESIRQHGIVQPMIVRFVPARYKIQEPDLESKDYALLERQPDGQWLVVDRCDEKNIKLLREGWPVHLGKVTDGKRAQTDHYVIVAGERRWRAAELAGLTEVPCLVRDVDAHRKFAIQFIENNQRENLSALEEAEAIHRQIEERRVQNAAFKVEDLASEIGMSRAALYGRLVLTRLHPPVREALLAGKITASVAGVVAIVPDPKQQEQLLGQLTNEDDYQNPRSVREVQELVDSDYCCQLGEAPFKQDTKFKWTTDWPEDMYQGGEFRERANGTTGYVKTVLTCKECPHRSGNMAEQFPELGKRPNVCTRPHCFSVKCKAHWVEKADDARLQGKTVMTTGEFRKVKGGYVEGGKHEWAQNRSGTFEELMGRHKPEPVLVATPEGLQKFYKKEEVQEACKKNGVRFNANHRNPVQTPEERRAEEEKQALREERGRLILALAPALAKGLGKLKPAEVWKALRPLAKLQHYSEPGHAIQKAAKDDQGYVLAFMFYHARVLQSVTDYNGEWQENLMELCKAAGVDLQGEEAKRAPKPELPLDKKTMEQGKLLAEDAGKGPRGMTPAARARWAKMKAQKGGGK